MEEARDVVLEEEMYDLIFDNYGFCRIYKHKQKMHLALYGGAGVCKYVNFEPDADHRVAYNALFTLHEAYTNVSGERKEKLLNDPKFQYMTRESNLTVLKKYDFNKVENLVQRERLEELLVNIRSDLQLPDEYSEDEVYEVQALRNQVVREMERLAESNPDAIPNTSKLIRESQYLFDVNESIKKEKEKKPLKIGI